MLRRLSLVLAFEGTVLLLIGIGYGAAGVLVDRTDTAPNVVAGVAAGLAGGCLLGLARATGRARSWARAPAVVLNVFPFPVALGVLQAGVWWIGVPMLALAGTVLYLFATPEVRAALSE